MYSRRYQIKWIMYEHDNVAGVSLNLVVPFTSTLKTYLFNVVVELTKSFNYAAIRPYG